MQLNIKLLITSYKQHAQSYIFLQYGSLTPYVLYDRQP